jgi:hypothetical protein
MDEEIDIGVWMDEEIDIGYGNRHHRGTYGLVEGQ